VLRRARVSQAHDPGNAVVAQREPRARHGLVLATGVLVVLGAVALAGLVTARPACAATAGAEKGVSFTGYWQDSYVGSGARASLSALHATGATWAMVRSKASPPAAG
jgi:hypothetical protein